MSGSLTDDELTDAAWCSDVAAIELLQFGYDLAIVLEKREYCGTTNTVMETNVSFCDRKEYYETTYVVRVEDRDCCPLGETALQCVYLSVI